MREHVLSDGAVPLGDHQLVETLVPQKPTREKRPEHTQTLK